jgi:hypothetical protein
LRICKGIIIQAFGLTGLGAVVAELGVGGIVVLAGGNAPSDVPVCIVKCSGIVGAFAYAQFGDIVGVGVVGGGTPINAQIGCWVACMVRGAVEGYDTGPVCASSVSGGIAASDASPESVVLREGIVGAVRHAVSVGVVGLVSVSPVLANLYANPEPAEGVAEEDGIGWAGLKADA